jgi:hypothetical protein
VIGDKGETSPHDCIGNRRKGEMGMCVFEDEAGE